MTAQDESQEKFLPKEPLDLPKEPNELPAHTSAPAKEQPASPIHHEETPLHLREVKTLLSWHAPGRPFQQHSKQYYLSILLIAVLFEIMAFLFAQYLLMIVILSLVFLVFSLALVPPHNFHYRISSEGITVEDYSYLWQELYDFYFKRRNNQDILHIRTQALIPGELTITLGDMDKEHVKSVLLPYLPYREVIKPTFMEKSGDWLSQNFPLEKPQSRTS